MSAEEFARRMERMRLHAERMRGSGGSGAAFEEFLLTVEELRAADEALRHRHEALALAHAAAEDERRRYQLLFQYAPDAYLLTDLSGIVREANHSAAHLLGMQPRDLAGKALTAFVAIEDRPRLRSEIGRWRSEPAAKSLELRIQPRAGQPFDASLTLSVARGGPLDRAIGFRWLVRDVSSHRQLTDELRLREESARRDAEASEAHAFHVQKLESIGVLAGGIAHDFNNLLHVVLGNADLALAHLPGDSPAREHLDEVVRATHRAADLTHQLLAYSGRGVVESRQLDLSLEVREMATLLRTAISKQTTLRWDLVHEPPAVTADPTQLRQVVMNLITNASESLGKDPGTVTLRTGLGDIGVAGGQPRPGVFLEVSDTGAGMDTDTLQRIFDPFFSTKFTGRGLGLAAVMGIVESHQGQVRIRSAPGEGTSFRILFPAVAGDADIAPRPLAGSGWRSHGNVLVVEDEEGVRDVVGRMLERLGFQVLTATDGVDALRVLEQAGTQVAAVLLDLSMPRMGGQETLQRLRVRSPDLPVILMSGYTEQEAAASLLNGSGGPLGFLQKPFLPEDLSSVLRQVTEPAPA